METGRRPPVRIQTSATKLKVADRRKRCLELRLAGLTFAQIAEQVGCSAKTAHKWVTTSLRETQTKYGQDADSLRTQEVDRLDRLLLGIWAQAKKGHLGAVDRAIKISERRAKLLGIDAPDQYEHAGRGGTPLLAPVIMMPKPDDADG